MPDNYRISNLVIWHKEVMYLKLSFKKVVPKVLKWEMKLVKWFYKVYKGKIQRLEVRKVSWNWAIFFRGGQYFFNKQEKEY